MQTYLNQLTSYNNRYYKNTSGANASNYVLNTLKGVRLYLLFCGSSLDLIHSFYPVHSLRPFRHHRLPLLSQLDHALRDRNLQGH